MALFTEEEKTLRRIEKRFAKGVVEYGLIEEGDIISIDINANTINMKVSDEELARRRANWTPKTKEVTGYLKRYAALVTSADKGAILKGN